ncbi:phage tail sheath subtilisin-like domain-containing protein [Desulfocurvibacter africanus]|uniref:phage tail sheath subtilisin-like domain-containing protein n=1 Tax=Desulfocurvibacter africanus TaxID=873 RepID=UPI0003FA1F87|nr:phage tail sheath subtilisin-like domain-containing protein [Desulfocurvibacter africanus]
MAISFDAIPILRTPGAYVEFNSDRAQQGPSVQDYTALIMGQKTAAGTAGALEFLSITNDQDPVTYFGAGSVLAQMCLAFRQANKTTRMVAVAMADDAAGVAATGSITLGGSPTAAGTLAVWIGGKRVRVSVASAQTPAAIATALAAAIGADTSLAVTAAVDGTDTAKVNVTAKNKGEAANELDVRVNYYSDERLPAGLTATVVAMSGGTGNPDVTTLIAAMADRSFNIAAAPWLDAANRALFKTEMARRWGPLVSLDGHIFAAKNAAFADLTTLGETPNDPHLSIAEANKYPSAPWEVAACLAGVAAYYAQIDPARPLQTLPLTGILAPAESDRFTREERDLLLYSGIATQTVDASGVVRVERAITTYRTSAAGATDTAYLDLETLLTLSYLRFDYRNLWLRKYPRHKLANDGTRYGAGQAVMTPKLAKAETIAWFRTMESLGLVEGVSQFKEDLIIERNVTDPNRLDVKLSPDLVNQLRVFAAQIQFLL